MQLVAMADLDERMSHCLRGQYAEQPGGGGVYALHPSFGVGDDNAVVHVSEHGGHLIALGTPPEVAQQVGGKDLEEAFIILQQRDEQEQEA